MLLPMSVRHELWTVSPGWLERSEEASPSLEFVQLATHRGEKRWGPPLPTVSGLVSYKHRTCSPELVKPLER